MTGARQCRHVWVDSGGGSRRPGLVIAWRGSTTGTWEAQVAIAQPSSVLLTWTPLAELHPVADDRWTNAPGLAAPNW